MRFEACENCHLRETARCMDCRQAFQDRALAWSCKRKKEKRNGSSCPARTEPGGKERGWGKRSG